MWSNSWNRSTRRSDTESERAADVKKLRMCFGNMFSKSFFSKNRVFATAKTTRSSFWGAPPMFLNHFLTSTEQGSWTKSCVLQGIVLWTFKTTSEKHERARSLHRRRHHVFGGKFPKFHLPEPFIWCGRVQFHRWHAYVWDIDPFLKSWAAF